MQLSEKNVLDCIDPEVIGATHEIDCARSWLPLFVYFVIKFFRKNYLRKKSAAHVVAVGGLDEALAVASAYFLRPVKGLRILWLRTIYTKEKGSRLNGGLRKALLCFEIFVIKRFFDVVIANGEDTADFYRARGISCVVISNAIELTKWSTVVPVKSSKIRIAFIGRLSEVKGIGSFLESIQLLKTKQESDVFEFHVAGDGPFRSRVETMERKGLLRYHGQLPNDSVPALLGNVDCCVALTFLNDSIGGGGVSNALIEQMASGQIIVAWDNGIFRKVLSDKDAFLVKQGSVSGLVESYLAIHRGSELAQSKISMARAKSTKYEIKAHVQSFFDVLAKAA